MARFNLSVPAIIAPNSPLPSNPRTPTTLNTKNICAGGAFIITDSPMKVGTLVDVDLHLSFFNGNAEHERRSNIHVSGSVVRIEDSGMALMFDEKYQITPLSKGPKVGS